MATRASSSFAPSTPDRDDTAAGTGHAGTGWRGTVRDQYRCAVLADCLLCCTKYYVGRSKLRQLRFCNHNHAYFGLVCVAALEGNRWQCWASPWPGMPQPATDGSGFVADRDAVPFEGAQQPNRSPAWMNPTQGVSTLSRSPSRVCRSLGGRPQRAAQDVAGHRDRRLSVLARVAAGML